MNGEKRGGLIAVGVSSSMADARVCLNDEGNILPVIRLYRSLKGLVLMVKRVIRFLDTLVKCIQFRGHCVPAYAAAGLSELFY